LDFKEVNQSVTTRRHPWELARIELIKKLIKESVPHEKPLQVLEIGCGDVFVLENLSREFPAWSFVGTDVAFPDSFLNEYKHDRIAISKDTLEAVNKIKGPIDLVLLLDVVEHVADDLKFLKSIANFSGVDNHTCFIITVPSFQWLFCSHDVFLQHYRRYSNSSLLKLFDHAGLKARRIGYFFSSLLVPRIVRVVLEKFNLLKPSRGLGTLGEGTLPRVLSKILAWDFRVTFALKRLKINIPGLSNYAVCKKSA
jgi:hypothetical protein